ncbi:MAG: hypothetical protein ACFFD8_00725 [Candidatus Thorarchaeota archaeon]
MALNLRQQIIVGFLVVLLVLLMPQAVSTAQTEEGQITIVFDFSHNQPFSPSNRNFSQAVEFFDSYPEYFVRTLEHGQLTAENLSRSHILVIPNPGTEYNASELQVITEYVQQGGSLFLLCDFQVLNRQIGNPTVLNSILQTLSYSEIKFTTVTEDDEIQGDAIVDPVSAEILPYNILVNVSDITLDVYRDTFGAGIDSLLVAGGSLTSNISELIIWNGGDTSQSVGMNGQILQNQPGWLAAFEIGQSHIVLSTSTTMFSDTSCVVTNQSWFNSVDNSVLWHNIFRWMATQLTTDPTPIMILFVVLVLITGVVVFIYSFWLRKRGR